ncbi:MAG: glycoside hydrolase family 30 protein [Candidatus Saccharibacteria bacterium]
MTKYLALAACLFIAGSCSKSEKVEWVATTNDLPWDSRGSAYATSGEEETSAVLIYPDSARQTIDGFGGCFNELGWDALQTLSETNRQAIAKDLFDMNTGCRFTIYRMPIGANDYAVNWYSHDETPEDYEMKNFSLERDKQRLIPYIKMAQSFNPQLVIWASPWCPPSWMKTNHHYACASNPQVNDLPEDRQGKEMVTQFRMEPKVLSAYALYFEKFIQGYQSEGIGISAVCPQNELNSCQNFPSCIWTPKDMAAFIGQYLGPKFEADGINVKIWLGTIERPQPERVDSILQDPKAGKYIAGVGFQWAGKDAIPVIHQKYPQMKLMQTETECGNGSNDWAAAEHTFGLMKHYFKNGANAYMYWNMVLDETGKSQWGWKQNSMISIEKATGKVTYNPEFYLMKHLSYFVEPGSKYIPVRSDENCLAFVKDGQLVIFYYNADAADKKCAFKVNDKTIAVNMKPKSFNSFKVKI